MLPTQLNLYPYCSACRFDDHADSDIIPYLLHHQVPGVWEDGQRPGLEQPPLENLSQGCFACCRHDPRAVRSCVLRAACCVLVLLYSATPQTVPPAAARRLVLHGPTVLNSDPVQQLGFCLIMTQMREPPSWNPSIYEPRPRANLLNLLSFQPGEPPILRSPALRIAVNMIFTGEPRPFAVETWWPASPPPSQAVSERLLHTQQRCK
ncbi:hypothetical protein CSOJ01_08807 [Colletotrichum sojae]|uniref:Uncharacterized protein n=1 Tax=Colletotrichum sojae TaxID=2175907 RepID=A0A8H6J4N3_9PEZI|nr:hypothetical protein CSOJ01_08807 [Colletotrichum sojae]